DGLRQMLAGAREWTPMPVRVTDARTVVCRSKFIWYPILIAVGTARLRKALQPVVIRDALGVTRWPSAAPSSLLVRLQHKLCGLADKITLSYALLQTKRAIEY